MQVVLGKCECLFNCFFVSVHRQNKSREKAKGKRSRTPTAINFSGRCRHNFHFSSEPAVWKGTQPTCPP